jgi:phosphoglucomutase
MTIDSRAGHPADPDQLTDINKLISAYYRPAEAADELQPVAFGTSGHRGGSLRGSFNEPHIIAITEAICRFRKQAGIDGPLFMGIDTHALSRPASETALGVLAAHGTSTMIDARDGYTPTPVISHAILGYNRGRGAGLADGIVITPSHNPPDDGGFKYNPPHGGPADGSITTWIEREANQIMSSGIARVRRLPYSRALAAASTRRYDFLDAYVNDLDGVVDMAAIRSADVKLGVDPMGGAGVDYWPAIAERYRLPLRVLSDEVDPQFAFMPLDWDGRIRMDPSSIYAMQRLIEVAGEFDVAWGCDTDHDRHGIVARSEGLQSPNAYLTVAIQYLMSHRPQWGSGVGIGKTVVSSSMIDRVTQRMGRQLLEVPVGFKWFVNGLVDGSLGFVGEESAGATFLRRNGTVWTTDKDGIIMGLLAAEMRAVTGRDPGELYRELTDEFGAPAYQRIDAPATAAEKSILSRLSGDQVSATHLAGDAITAVMTTAPGNGAGIGGVKVSSKRGWFAARPSGTEDVYKLYAESFDGEVHLRQIQAEAQSIIEAALLAG